MCELDNIGFPEDSDVAKYAKKKQGEKEPASLAIADTFMAVFGYKRIKEDKEEE